VGDGQNLQPLAGTAQIQTGGTLGHPHERQKDQPLRTMDNRHLPFVIK